VAASAAASPILSLKPKAQIVNQKNRRLRRFQHVLALKTRRLRLRLKGLLRVSEGHHRGIQGSSKGPGKSPRGPPVILEGSPRGVPGVL
jgi:hypothetical protein